MKQIILFFSLFMASILLCGCETSKSFTFKVETGDNIKIELNTNDGYDISSNVPFEISKDDKKLTKGFFVTLEQYEEYLKMISNDDLVKIIEEDNKNGLTYLFYSYDNKEYNYILKVNDSNTCLLLTNEDSESSAKIIFEKLKISKV